MHTDGCLLGHRYKYALPVQQHKHLDGPLHALYLPPPTRFRPNFGNVRGSTYEPAGYRSMIRTCTYWSAGAFPRTGADWIVEEEQVEDFKG